MRPRLAHFFGLAVLAGITCLASTLAPHRAPSAGPADSPVTRATAGSPTGVAAEPLVAAGLPAEPHAARATGITPGLRPPSIPDQGSDPGVARAGADAEWFGKVKRSIAASEYEASRSTAGFQAPNRAHDFRTYFGETGIAVVPRRAADDRSAWRFAWRLSRWGRPGRLAFADPVAPIVDGARVSYVRPGLTEWYENSAKGLEQGFELDAPPQGRGPLCIEGRVDPGLRAKMETAGGAVDFLDARGHRVLRYCDLSVRDAKDRTVPARLLLSDEGTTLTIRIEDAGATYPLLVDPLMTSPAWTAESDQEGAEFGFWVATAGDVNGDGYSDVIIGADQYDDGETDEGAAFVYYGSPAGLSSSPDWTAETNVEYSYFGFRVAPAGDVNGDGYDDVMVRGDVSDPEQHEGRVYVYEGSPSGLGTEPAWTAEGNQDFAGFGISMGTAGDVNGDGFDDIIIGAYTYSNGQDSEGRAYVYLGSASGLEAAPVWTAESNQATSFFGISVATAGDVNGDGYDDVIVGADWFTNGELNEGRAFLYYGSAAGPVPVPGWIAEGNQERAYFGTSVSTAGDVNGDGFSDVIVGAYGYSNGQDGEGRAFVYYGSSAGLQSFPSWIAESNNAYAEFGEAVATAGDINGDGFADVLVGAFAFTDPERDEGAAFAYLGSAGGLDTTPVWVTEGDQQDAFYAYSLGTAGDVNGDGYSDVIVGSYLYDDPETDEGRVSVFYGSAGGLLTAWSWTAESNQANAFLGWHTGVASAGDVNGDGYSDVIVGAPYYDNGETDEGRAFVYLGSARGLSTTPAWTAEPDQANALFGISVAGAGDVNGDGYSDVIVGAENGTGQVVYEGQAFVYLGSPSGLSADPAWVASSGQSSCHFGNPVAGAGDVNGDGFSDVIIGAWEYDNGETDEGRAFVYLGSADGLAATPAWTAESDQAYARFGSSVATAGDVNGDGFSDVIVAAQEYDDGQSDEGEAFLYLGSPNGPEEAPAWTFDTNQGGAGYSMTVGAAGDVNGDGYSDVIIGLPYFSNGQTLEGGAYVFHGSSGGLWLTAAWFADSDQASAFFGAAAGTAGDVNGDGYSDVVVSAPLFDNGQTNEGRVFVYHGGPAGLEDNPAWVEESNDISGQWGSSAATAGDVNGDGFCDLIIGEQGFNNGQTGEGRAILYYGGQGDGLDRIPRQARVDDTAPVDLLGLSDSQDGFRLKALARTPAGRGQVRIECEVKPYGTPFDGQGLSLSPWSDTGVSGPNGSGVEIGRVIDGLDSWSLYTWRLRIATDSPFFPHSRWFYPAGNGVREADIQTNGVPASTGGDRAGMPGSALLEPARPNPFRPGGEIAYSLARAGRVRLAVYDIAGRRRAVLIDRSESAGRHTLRWNGRDGEGSSLPSGVYLLRLEVPGGGAVRKVVLGR